MHLIQMGPWGILNPSESEMNQRYRHAREALPENCEDAESAYAQDPIRRFVLDSEIPTRRVRARGTAQRYSPLLRAHSDTPLPDVEGIEGWDGSRYAKRSHER